METKINKDDEISILEDALRVLKVVFDKYAFELYSKHDVLLDEYDLTDLEILIAQKREEPYHRCNTYMNTWKAYDT